MADIRKEGRWLFVLKTEDKAGVATSVTAAFSGRGISIESFLGYSSDLHVGGEGESIIMITFRAFERRMRTVQRALKRLELVRDVLAYDYENEPELVKTATVRVKGEAGTVEAAAEGCNVVVGIQETGGGEALAAVKGRPTEVDAVVRRLRQDGRLVSCVYSLLPPI